MNGFTTQYAIRMPNGELYAVPKPKQTDWAAMLGVYRAPEPEQAPEMRAVIFDSAQEAAQLLEELREKAASIGVTNLGACVVQRLCSPFTVGEPAIDFAEYVDAWLKDQGAQR